MIRKLFTSVMRALTGNQDEQIKAEKEVVEKEVVSALITLGRVYPEAAIKLFSDRVKVQQGLQPAVELAAAPSMGIPTKVTSEDPDLSASCGLDGSDMTGDDDTPDFDATLDFEVPALPVADTSTPEPSTSQEVPAKSEPPTADEGSGIPAVSTATPTADQPEAPVVKSEKQKDRTQKISLVTFIVGQTQISISVEFYLFIKEKTGARFDVLVNNSETELSFLFKSDGEYSWGGPRAAKSKKCYWGFMHSKVHHQYDLTRLPVAITMDINKILLFTFRLSEATSVAKLITQDKVLTELSTRLTSAPNVEPESKPITPTPAVATPKIAYKDLSKVRKTAYAHECVAHCARSYVVISKELYYYLYSDTNCKLDIVIEHDPDSKNHVLAIIVNPRGSHHFHIGPGENYALYDIRSLGLGLTYDQVTMCKDCIVFTPEQLAVRPFKFTFPLILLPGKSNALPLALNLNIPDKSEPRPQTAGKKDPAPLEAAKVLESSPEVGTPAPETPGPATVKSGMFTPIVEYRVGTEKLTRYNVHKGDQELFVIARSGQSLSISSKLYQYFSRNYDSRFIFQVKEDKFGNEWLVINPSLKGDKRWRPSAGLKPAYYYFHNSIIDRHFKLSRLPDRAVLAHEPFPDEPILLSLIPRITRVQVVPVKAISDINTPPRSVEEAVIYASECRNKDAAEVMSKIQNPGSPCAHLTK